MKIRRTIDTSDRPAIESLLVATAFFNTEEVAVAMELVDDRLANGEGSHYRFIVAEEEGTPIAYACWGPIPGTVASADLYWLAVHPEQQGRGIGRQIVREAELWMSEQKRRRVYLETATRSQYAPTRAFYLSCGYQLVAQLEDYYAPGDGKAFFLKVLP